MLTKFLKQWLALFDKTNILSLHLRPRTSSKQKNYSLGQSCAKHIRNLLDLRKGLTLFFGYFQQDNYEIEMLAKRLGTTIPDKTFEIKWSNPVNLDRKRKVWYLFLRVFLTAVGKV